MGTILAAVPVGFGLTMDGRTPFPPFPCAGFVPRFCCCEIGRFVGCCDFAAALLPPPFCFLPGFSGLPIPRKKEKLLTGGSSRYNIHFHTKNVSVSVGLGLNGLCIIRITFATGKN